jgi:HSP20 family protein
MNSGSPAEQPGRDDACIIEDQKFIAAKKIDEFYKKPILKRAGRAIQQEKPGGFAAIERSLRDAVLRQVVVEFIQAHARVKFSSNCRTRRKDWDRLCGVTGLAREAPHPEVLGQSYIVYLFKTKSLIVGPGIPKLILDNDTRIFYYLFAVIYGGKSKMRILTRWEPSRGVATLQDQINRLFNDSFQRTDEEASLSAWAPAVDIYETEHELVVKADLPEVDPKDLDIRVENNLLTIRGERKFEKKVDEDHYLRVERSYGSFARSFTLANTVNPEAIKADYQNGVLTLSIPKREEAKPKQIKVNVGTPAMAAAAGR